MTRSSNKTASVGKTVVPLIALLAFTIPLAESVRSGEAADQKKDNPALNERVAAINKLVAGDYERLEKLYKHLHTHPELSQQEEQTAAAEGRKPDVTKSPIPRFDLARFNNYLYIGIQCSRGCPYNCEFCDIIELYGRVPRFKNPDQVIVPQVYFAVAIYGNPRGSR